MIKERFSRNQSCYAIRRSLSHDQLYQRLRLYANGRRLISIMSINLFFLFFFLFLRWPASPVSFTGQKQRPSVCVLYPTAQKRRSTKILDTVPRYDRVISRAAVKFNWCSRECKFSTINSPTDLDTGISIRNTRESF